jgi:hypothetical protein
VRVGVGHFRAARPVCMGTVWWQLNDCWPGPSWAVVGGDGRRKPAWYALRAACRPRAVTLESRVGRAACSACPCRSMSPVRGSPGGMLVTLLPGERARFEVRSALRLDTTGLVSVPVLRCVNDRIFHEPYPEVFTV